MLVQAGRSVVDTARLVALHHHPAISFCDEHDTAVFDTKQELWLTLEEGRELFDLLFQPPPVS